LIFAGISSGFLVQVKPRPDLFHVFIYSVRVGDKCPGMLEAAVEVFPESKYQRCIVHFYRNVFSVVPRGKIALVAKMLKAIHAQESKAALMEKAIQVIGALKAMRLKEAAQKIQDGIEKTLTYTYFPYEHWTKMRTNNAIERVNREIKSIND
jgi:transposase-like protein